MGLSVKQESGILDLFKYNLFFSKLYVGVKEIRGFFMNRRFSDEAYLKRQFKKYHGYELNLRNPLTLNEKLQWLKLNDRNDYYTTFADKYAVREYIKNTFGENYLIPLVLQTTHYHELQPANLPDYPVVIKTNHGFGNTTIIRNKNLVNWNKIRIDYMQWLRTNYYYIEREWQYKNIKPCIIVEKMLLNNSGKVPNDYKLNFIDGRLEFIYVSVDREGANKRNIYNAEWKPMHFTWARKGTDLSKLRGEEIQPPSTLPQMIEFGSVIAKLYKYVRVDFYDIDGTLFFGEITQSHGGGFDQILPFEYDIKYGEKIHLPMLKENR